MSSSKIDTSKIRIGTMMNSLRLEEKEFKKIISFAYDLGIKNIDISPSYISGKSIRLTSQVINLINKDDIKLHTKVGSKYKKTQKKSKVYLSNNEISESLAIVRELFPNNKIETILIHLQSTRKTIKNAILFLKSIREKEKFKNIGICDFESDFIKETIKNLEIKEFHIQKRYCLDIIKSPNIINAKYIAYGLLNAGSFLDNKVNTHSRKNTAQDSYEINERNALILKNNKFKYIEKNCNELNIDLLDYSIASPFFNGYNEIIIGPTKESHLGPIVRMLDKNYWNKLKLMHQLILEFDKKNVVI